MDEGQQENLRIHISGYWLKSNGWDKKGFTWTRRENVITYDGCDWLFNGWKIKYVDEIKQHDIQP